MHQRDHDLASDFAPLAQLPPARGSKEPPLQQAGQRLTRTEGLKPTYHTGATFHFTRRFSLRVRRSVTNELATIIWYPLNCEVFVISIMDLPQSIASTDARDP